MKHVDMNTPKISWLPLILMTLLFVGLIFWVFFAKIPIEIRGSGLLVYPGGVNAIVTKHSGHVDEIFVTEGSRVSVGDPIISINQNELKHKIAYHENLGDELLVFLKRFNRFAGSAAALEAQRVAHEYRKNKILLNKLKTELNEKSRSTSFQDGHIIELFIHEGTYLNAGDVIGTIENRKEQSLELIMFVSPSESRDIVSGMTVYINPQTISDDEYGSLIGKVKDVSAYPVSEEKLNAIFHNSLLSDYWKDDLPPIMVVVELNATHETYSGYEWTTDTGPAQSIRSGLKADASILVDEVPVYEYLFPRIRHYLEFTF